MLTIRSLLLPCKKRERNGRPAMPLDEKFHEGYLESCERELIAAHEDTVNAEKRVSLCRWAELRAWQEAIKAEADLKAFRRNTVSV
jgi:hypothetical protein